MPSIRLAAVALLLCAPVAAHAADDTAPSTAPSEGEAQAEKPKKVCRMETGTGSVMPKRVCRTPEQVEADQEAARRTREAMDRSRRGM
jgi:hypothetical protein